MKKQTQSHSTPAISLIVVPRERFSFARESLESLFASTSLEFELIYVDGNSPPDLCSYLQAKAEDKKFKVIRTDHYLTPNSARNIGLRQAEGKYIVFVDNDVIVSPGWLEALVHCAEETDAIVVGPLMCQDFPLHQTVHFAGGEAHVWIDEKGRRRLREKMYSQGRSVSSIHNQLHRKQVELAEFHCVLVRRSIFDSIGRLDEHLLNTKEHLDFCMTVNQLGGSVYFEPNSVVTYVPGPPLQWSDLHFYMLRWSDDWTLRSLEYLREKWNLAEDGYFQAKYKKLGWRRFVTIIQPIARRITFGIGAYLIARAIAKIEHMINYLLTYNYRRKHLRT